MRQYSVRILVSFYLAVLVNFIIIFFSKFSVSAAPEVALFATGSHFGALANAHKERAWKSYSSGKLDFSTILLTVEVFSIVVGLCSAVAAHGRDLCREVHLKF